MNQMGYLLAGVSRTKPIRQKETRGVHTLGQQSWATRLFNNLEECRTILGNNLGQQSWTTILGNNLGQQFWATILDNNLGQQSWATILGNNLGQQAWAIVCLFLWVCCHLIVSCYHRAPVSERMRQKQTRPGVSKS